MFKNNLEVYFERFMKHLAEVKNDPSDINFMDLSHSLRCLIDVKSNIDKLVQEDEYTLKFPHARNMKKVKRSTKGDVNFNEPIEFKGVMIFNTSFDFRELSDEELDKKEFVEASYYNRELTFTEWLGCDVATFFDEERYFPINREMIIKRISNKFGGSHPFESAFYMEDNTSDMKTINQRIDMFQVTRFCGVYQGYIIVLKFADSVAKTLYRYFTEYSSEVTRIRLKVYADRCWGAGA